ncbi:MAG: ATP-dependent DNA ligase [Opitutales bacterium]
MRRFTQLFIELDESNKTNAKVAALKRYFAEAPAADAAWALWFLSGNRFKALVRSAHLREWVGTLTGYPDWLVAECYERVGESAETVTLLLPLSTEGTDLSLAEIVTQHIQTLGDWDPPVQFQLLRELWPQLDRPQALVFHKLLTGGFRVGASKALVVRALAELSEVEKEVMAHRLMGRWQPTASFYERIRAQEEVGEERSRPYPFFLASPLEGAPADLEGTVDDWQVEWKWDGIRAQLIKRDGELFLWSRGEEALAERFPEIIRTGAYLPNGTVLDGEVLVWPEGAERPAGFDVLQTRIGRKHLSAAFLAGAPAVFLAYDVMESGGVDLRPEPLHVRRERLEALLAALPEGGALRPSPLVEASGWGGYEEFWDTSRERGVEGLMLKRRTSPYRAGRVRGDWWKWKVDPYTADLVMVYAQAGSGRRASLFTDYTLAARDGDALVPVAKAYSGLTDAEIRTIDRWIKRHTLAKRGPVRTVPPEQVFEIAFEGIRASPRHKSGLALRFPRIVRWREDKPVAEIDTVETLRALLGGGGAP